MESAIRRLEDLDIRRQADPPPQFSSEMIADVRAVLLNRPTSKLPTELVDIIMDFAEFWECQSYVMTQPQVVAGSWQDDVLGILSADRDNASRYRPSIQNGILIRTDSLKHSHLKRAYRAIVFSFTGQAYKTNMANGARAWLDASIEKPPRPQEANDGRRNFEQWQSLLQKAITSMPVPPLQPSHSKHSFGTPQNVDIPVSGHATFVKEFLPDLGEVNHTVTWRHDDDASLRNPYVSGRCGSYCAADFVNALEHSDRIVLCARTRSTDKTCLNRVEEAQIDVYWKAYGDRCVASVEV